MFSGARLTKAAKDSIPNLRISLQEPLALNCVPDPARNRPSRKKKKAAGVARRESPGESGTGRKSAKASASSLRCQGSDSLTGLASSTAGVVSVTDSRSTDCVAFSAIAVSDPRMEKKKRVVARIALLERCDSVFISHLGVMGCSPASPLLPPSPRP